MRPTVEPGREPPWWLQEAPLDPPMPALEGDVEADVAIVGGGYTGLWTAAELLRRDPSLRVVVLEADRCGHGPSGRNGGFLNGFSSHLARTRDRLGDEGALATARAAEGVYAAVRALDEDVWLREAGTLEVSAAPGQDEEIVQAVESARDLGVPEEAVPCSGQTLDARCRSPVFRAGVFFREGGTVQPARLVRALRRAALAAGATVHERSRVIRIEPGALVTAAGRVRAPELVVATNAWAARWRRLRPWLTPFGSYVVLTEPVPDLLRDIGWTGGEAILDGRMFLHYFRTTEDGRVLMGSGSGPMGFGGRIDDRFFSDSDTSARAEAGLSRLLPQLAEARITHSWGGPIDVSADQLPLFGTVPGTRIHYGAGYSGNGVGPSWLGGQILASLALGSADEWTRLPLVGRRVRPLPPEPVRRIGGGFVRASILACERADEDGRAPNLGARVGRALPTLLHLRIGTR